MNLNFAELTSKIVESGDHLHFGIDPEKNMFAIYSINLSDTKSNTLLTENVMLGHYILI